MASSVNGNETEIVLQNTEASKFSPLSQLQLFRGRDGPSLPLRERMTDWRMRGIQQPATFSTILGVCNGDTHVFGFFQESIQSVSRLPKRATPPIQSSSRLF